MTILGLIRSTAEPGQSQESGSVLGRRVRQSFATRSIRPNPKNAMLHDKASVIVILSSTLKENAGGCKTIAGLGQFSGPSDFRPENNRNPQSTTANPKPTRLTYRLVNGGSKWSVILCWPAGK
jgi:hypothetical protein